jgi:hypothetical protein
MSQGILSVSCAGIERKDAETCVEYIHTLTSCGGTSASTGRRFGPDAKRRQQSAK